jgi:hypothetical protein
VPRERRDERDPEPLTRGSPASALPCSRCDHDRKLSRLFERIMRA